MRGGFHPGATDGVPALQDGAAPRTLILLGNAGSGMWDAFAATGGVGNNPLDRWSERVVRELGRQLGGEPLFPFGGPPYLPFLRWAQRAEAVYPSPLGPLIHPDYGLWHAYRGALAFACEIALPARDARPNPCDTCQDRPCLSACPVNAFSGESYDVPACTAHLRRSDGSACLDGGCLARHACPAGQDYRYAPAQAGFHMRAFLRNQDPDIEAESCAESG